MPKTEPCILLTPGAIADELGVELHHITYILATRPNIRPAAKAGILRVYNRDALQLIEVELNAIDARRGKGGA